LFISELLSLKSVLELEDGGLLHGIGDLWVKNNRGDDNSLNFNTLVGKDNVKMFEHTGGMGFSS